MPTAEKQRAAESSAPGPHRSTPRLFPSTVRSAAAAVLSLFAVTGVVGYVVGPSWAAPKLIVGSSAAAKPAVSGVVKGPSGKPLADARIKLVFAKAGGSPLQSITVRTDRRGRYRVTIPTGARKLTLTVTEPGRRGRSTSKSLTLRPGRSVTTTAVFPRRGTAVMPGLFPY